MAATEKKVSTVTLKTQSFGVTPFSGMYTEGFAGLWRARYLSENPPPPDPRSSARRKPTPVVIPDPPDHFRYIETRSNTSHTPFYSSHWKSEMLPANLAFNDYKLSRMNGSSLDNPLRPCPSTGFRAEKFLPLRARVLLEMIVRIQKDLLLDAPCSKKESLDKLTAEFFYSLNMLHACLDQCFVENSAKPEWAIQAHVNQLTKQILALPVGSSYGYAGGWKGHAIYIEFDRRADSPRSLIVRLNNLGERYNEFHINKQTPFQHKSGSGDKVLPYVLQFPLTERAARAYIEKMVKAKFELSDKGGALLYDIPTKLADKIIVPRNKIEQWYSWRRAQNVGNCVVKNAQPGLQVRWQTGHPAQKRSHQFYYYFREKEHQFIPIKSYLSVALKSSGFNAPAFSGPSSSSMSSVEEMDIPSEIVEEMMAEARSQGYTDLHLAVVSGDLSKVREAIMVGAKPEHTTKNGYNGLHLALLHNQLGIANYLLSVVTTPEKETVYYTWLCAKRKEEKLSEQTVITEKKYNVDARADVKGLRAKFEGSGGGASGGFRFDQK